MWRRASSSGHFSFCRDTGHQAEPHSPGRAIYGSAARIDHLGELGVVAYHTAPAPRSSKMLKRGLRLIIAVPAMILLLPVMAVIALAIRLEDRGRVIFARSRPGLDGGSLQDLQVPDDDRRRRGAAQRSRVAGRPARAHVQAAERPQADENRGLPEAVEPRRASPALERGQGRDESRRPAARAGRARGPLFA